jgi:oxygen-dependent protoporphyrinogen oxidase
MVAADADESPGGPEDPARHDVVIVGAGLAGLTAANELSDRDVVLFEAEDRVGGRIRSEARDPYWLNEGAHLFGGPQTPVGALIERCGLEARPVEGSFTAVAMDGRFVRHGSPLALLFGLPLSLRGRVALARAGARILYKAQRYQDFATPKPGETPAEVNRRLLTYMNDKTFAQILGTLPADTDQLFRAISNRAQAAPEQIAAGGAVAAFALVLAKDASLGRNIIGGAGRLVDALHKAHRATVHTRSRVTSVTQESDGVTVTYSTQTGETQRVRANTAIVTTPPHTAAEMVLGLPADTRDALQAIRYGPSVVMSLITRETHSVPWDGVYSAVVPGRSFNMFFNQGDVLRNNGDRRRDGGSLMVYASGELGRQTFHEDDTRIRDRFLKDLYEVFPDCRHILQEIVIKRWEYGTAYPHPGRALLQPALEKPLGRVALAGDYLGAWFTDSAVLTARDAVRRIEAYLGPPRPVGRTPEGIG